MNENALFSSNPTYDDLKNSRNIEKHGISFEVIHQIEWKDAFTD